MARKQPKTSRRLPAQEWWAVVDEDDCIINFVQKRSQLRFLLKRSDRMARVRVTELRRS